MEDERKKFKWYECVALLQNGNRKYLTAILAKSRVHALEKVKNIFFFEQPPSFKDGELYDLYQIIRATKIFECSLVDISDKQFDVFEQICVGNMLDHKSKNINHLINLGFIAKDAKSVYSVNEFIREQWLNWCQELFWFGEAKKKQIEAILKLRREKLKKNQSNKNMVFSF